MNIETKSSHIFNYTQVINKEVNKQDVVPKETSKLSKGSAITFCRFSRKRV